MLKSGRAEGDQAARADAAYNSAWIASNLATEPVTVTVGHGPDRPNTPHIDGFYSGPPAAFCALLLWPRRSAIARLPSVRADRAESRSRSAEPRALCYAQINTHTAASQPFVTECPAVMQPNRR